MNCCYERCVERIYHVLRNDVTCSVAHCVLRAGESPMVRFYQCMFMDNHFFDFPGKSPYDYLLIK